MNDDYVNFYSDAQRYDLVMGACASGDPLNFYRRQVAHYGEPVLELACGSGRLTIPFAKVGTDITGMDISEEMLNLATSKASRSGVNVRFLQGDMRSFDPGAKFKFIFIPAQSLSHLHTREEVEHCLACVQRHLADEGRLLIELFNTSVGMLARETNRRCPVGQYEDPNGGPQVFVTEESRYDAASQIKHIRWFFQDQRSDEETVLSFEMRQFFPQEIDALLWYNGFTIEQKYGGYDEREFSSDAPKQLILCRPK
jgi:ubiquinone/menaquinone biosynthesis C-methylase UbiE